MTTRTMKEEADWWREYGAKANKREIEIFALGVQYGLTLARLDYGARDPIADGVSEDK